MPITELLSLQSVLRLRFTADMTCGTIHYLRLQKQLATAVTQTHGWFPAVFQQRFASQTALAFVFSRVQVG